MGASYGPGSRPSGHAPTGRDASRIDPSRGDFAERAGKWLHGMDTGMSSLAIFHYMTLGVTGGATPSDSADFGRCVRLLDTFPEWRSRLPEMANVSDEWALLMRHWAKIERAYSYSPRGDEAYNLLTDLWWEKKGSHWHRKPVPPRDSDRNPEGEKPQALSAEHESAGRKASPETGSA